MRDMQIILRIRPNRQTGKIGNVPAKRNPELSTKPTFKVKRKAIWSFCSPKKGIELDKLDELDRIL
jgi:hypothetical protein